MAELPFHITDIILAIIILLSGIIAFARGFVKEVLSISSWIVAAIAATHLYPYVTPYLEPYLEGREAFSELANLIAGVLIFIVVLVVLSILTSSISRLVRSSDIGALDRSLGFLFGLLRGLVVIALAYIVLVQFSPPDQHPTWIREARAQPVVAYSARMLARLAPNEIAQTLETAERFGDDLSRQVIDAGSDLARDAATADSGDETGYKESDRQELGRKFRILQKPAEQ